MENTIAVFRDGVGGIYRHVGVGMVRSRLASNATSFQNDEESRLGGAIGRAIDGGATAVTGGSATTTHLFQQSKLYGSGFSSVKQPRWFSPHHSIAKHSTPRSAEECVAGTMFFSVAASSSSSSLAEDVHDAKELPPQSMKLFNPKDVVLYQYQACPFCNKVKAFLDYHDIPYKIVEVNPINKKEIKWSDYKKVPILVVDGEQMVDSSDIVDKLFERIHPEISVDSASDGDEERKWRGWVDNHLVHVLSPNIYRTTSEALESFDYITTHGIQEPCYELSPSKKAMGMSIKGVFFEYIVDIAAAERGFSVGNKCNFSLTERIVAKYAGAAAMYFVAKKLKKKHNITDERAALYEAAETWVDALNGRKYLGGSNPNLADLAVFGVLRPIRHLKSGRDMVEHTRIGEWYTRMESTVGEPSRIMA
ncbi:hypothetical protein TEA_003832 [Camellia sinensis var. sinensis]|uniref:Prostaglandin E synthase 2 n=1 Tax=Camellia sinensis var. sinensis TaxID=542762 RepID=A0A4S4EUZ0_CAMSN|nr:hypothetical protein TEA_003832 [Camellia sinensis var. sinensis]